MIRYKEGHRNSDGELAPWTIVSHKTRKILSSHKSKSAAKKHLKQMEYYKHAKHESFDEWLDGQDETPLIEAVMQLFDAYKTARP